MRVIELPADALHHARLAETLEALPAEGYDAVHRVRPWEGVRVSRVFPH